MKTQSLLAALAFALLALAGCSGKSHHADTTLAVDFGPIDREGYDTALRVDTRDRPTEGLYERDSVTPREDYTVHDLLLDWSEETGVSVELAPFTFDTGDGYFLSRVGGVPEDTFSHYWDFRVGGRSSSVGVSDVPVTDGMAVRFVLLENTFEMQGGEGASGGLAADPVAASQDEPVTVQGTAPEGATLSFALVSPAGTQPLASQPSAGAWSLEVDPPAGRSTLRVTADDGRGVDTVDVPLVRLVPVTFEVNYGTDLTRADSSDVVWLDVHGFASAPSYLEQGAAHPGYANVHDLMVTWEAATGSLVDYEWDADFDAFSVAKINGAGNPVASAAPPWWLYTRNGEAADGITIEEVAKGDVVRWSLGSDAI